MKSNTLWALNNHLFAELERLGDEELKGEDLKEEIDRAKAISGVASQVVANASLVLKAQQFMDEKLDADSKLPGFLIEGE